MSSSLHNKHDNTNNHNTTTTDTTNKFLKLDYLRQGTARQQLAYDELTQTLDVPTRLAAYRPVLAGTIPLDIDVPGKSDLDVLCQILPGSESSTEGNDDDNKNSSTTLETALQDFANVVQHHYGHYPDFTIVQRSNLRNQPSYVLASFRAPHFEIEVFGQARLVTDQHAYRHLCIEARLLQAHGPAFADQIRQLKESGVKTEPAFCQVLQIQTEDPYQALLDLEESGDLP